MSRNKSSSIFPLPDVQKSPLSPYEYRCFILENNLRVLAVTINDIPEGTDKEPVNEHGELEVVSSFNKDFYAEPFNRTPHKLMTGNDVRVEQQQLHQCNNSKAKTNSKKNERKVKDFVGAAAMAVGVGDVSDPGTLYGMAHLTEHCLFLGSQKYPRPDQFFDFVHRCQSGTVNASTSFFYTDYFVNMDDQKEYLEAVERLADMLMNPILDPHLIKMEVNAVDCEFTMRMRGSSIGLLQILRSLTHPDHPMHRLSCGNRETLNDPKLGTKMKAWQSQYYVANLMTLTLVGTMPLDELESLAVKYFSKLKKGDLTAKTPWAHVKESSHSCGNTFNNFFRVNTYKSARDLLISFSLSPDTWKAVGPRPLRFISYLLMDRGPNGLRTYLNRNGLSVDFYAGPMERDMCYTEFNSLYSILVVLSEKGLENYELVLEAVFAYIRMLQEAKPQQWFFEEMQKFHQHKFHYAYQTNNIFSRRAMARAVKNSHAMQGLHPWRVLTSVDLMSNFNEEIYAKTLKQMNPCFANIILVSSAFKNIVNKTEPYYRYEYRQDKVPPKLMERMKASNLKFGLPARNPYLNLTIGRFLTVPANYERPAKLTEVDAKAAILCAAVEEPKHGYLAKIKCAMYIKSEVIDRWEPNKLEIITDLIAYHLELAINLTHKPASGTLVNINTGTRGGTLAIFIRCPSQYFVSIFDGVFKTFLQLETKIHEFCFEAKKERLIDAILDKWMDNLSYAEAIAQYIFNNPYVSYPLLKYRLKELKWATFVNRVAEFRKKFFLTLCLEGCIEKSQVDDLSGIIKGWTVEPPELGSIPLYGCMAGRTMIMERERCLRILGRLPIDETSLIQNYYQLEEGVSIEMLEKLCKMLMGEAFYELRTKQQLGYHTTARLMLVRGVPIMIVQLITRAAFYTPAYINDRINAMLTGFYNKYIKSKNDFTKYIKTWNKEYQNMNWKTLKSIYENYLLPTGCRFRCFSIQICSPALILKARAKDSNNSKYKMGHRLLKIYSAALGDMTIVTAQANRESDYFVHNVDWFKNSLSQFPLPEGTCEVASPFEEAGGETSEEE